MPDFLDDLIRTGKDRAGSFLSGYVGQGDSPFGGLFGGIESLGREVIDPTKYAPPRPVIDSPQPEEPLTGEVEVAPGVTALGANRVKPVAEKVATLNPKDVDRLISNVGDPGGGFSEIRLPDGTMVKGITPDQMASATTAEKVEGGGEAGSFLDFFGTPQFQHLAGRIAQAIVPDPTHGANVAGGIGAQLGTNRAYDEYFQRLQSGESVESLNRDQTFSILPPELKANALKDVLSGERADVSNRYTEQLIKQSQAIEGATPTVEQRFDHETMIAMIRNKTNMNLWQVWGYGQMRHKETGEIVKVPTAPRGTGGSDPTVQNRQWYKQAYNEAVRSPSVLQFVKGNIVVGADGTPVFQWTDPIRGQEALQQAMQEKLKLFQAQGLVPPGFLDLTGGQNKPKVEF